MLGYPRITTYVHFRGDEVKIGAYNMNNEANSAYYEYKSSCCDQYSDCYLGMMHQQAKSYPTMNTGAKMMSHLIDWMGDPEVGKYVRSLPYPSLRFPTFMHAFAAMAEEMIQELRQREERRSRFPASDANRRKDEMIGRTASDILEKCRRQ